MDSSGQVRCAIIGLGRIASTLEDDALREKPASHAGAIGANPDSVLVGGFDLSGEARDGFADRWGVPVFDDAREMIRRLRPGILHIATHEDSHLEYLAAAIAEEVPVVVLEKPVSDSLRRARRIARRLERSRTRVVVNHERRYSRDYIAVRQAVADERFGPLQSVSGRLYMGMKRPVRDILLHDGTHMLDIVPFLTGHPITRLRVTGSGRNPNNVYVTARSGNSDILLEAGNRRDHLVFELELSFTAGRIRVGNGVFEFSESRESPHYENFKSLVPLPDSLDGPTGYFARMVEDAVRIYREPGAEPVSSYVDGVASLAMVMGIRRCLKRF